MANFTRLNSAIEDGISKRLHTGVQVYVSQDGNCVLNQGFGMAGPDQRLTAESVMLWRSAGKPLTALLVLRQIEAGRLSLADPLADSLPQLANSDLGRLTAFDLLTHTSGLPLIETGWPLDPWDRILQRIDAAAATTSPEAAYQPQGTWFILGEVLRLLDPQRRNFRQLLQQDLLQPLGLQHSGCGLDAQAVTDLADRLPTLYERQRGQLEASPYSSGRWLTEPSPGGNLRGPVSDLGRFYECLLAQGQLPDGTPYVSPQTVAAMVHRQRPDLFDSTLQHKVDFGLGVIVDSGHHGLETVPYGFGRYCSDRSFGHGGAQCAMGFCDPAHRLVVAWAANGFCGEGLHQRRNRAINEAIYADLGLTDET